MTPADSLVTPFEFGPVGSRGTYAIGSAVINAAEDARRKLLEFAAPKLGVTPEELDTADGVVFVKGRPREEHKMEGHGQRPDHTRVRPFRARFYHVQLHDELCRGGGRYGDGKGGPCCAW